MGSLVQATLIAWVSACLLIITGIITQPGTLAQAPIPVNSSNSTNLTTPDDVNTTDPEPEPRPLPPRSIELGAHLRDYVGGPIEGSFALSNYDPVVLYAGKMENVGQVNENKKVKIYKWLLLGDSMERSVCVIQRVYNFGERVLFRCPTDGNFIAYVQNDEIDSEIISNAVQIKPAEEITYVHDSQKFVRMFLILKPDNKTLSHSEFQSDVEKIQSDSSITMSDPLELMKSLFCYRWNYRLDITAHVNFVFKESQPKSGFGEKGSYLLAELLVWIIEPVTEHSRALQNTQEGNSMKVSEYSKRLTRKFQSKNLIPCLRKVHPIVEQLTEVVFIEERDSPSIKTPHWKMELKIHTDSLVTTLDDISFTISSLQHAVLFKCFVGDVRVMVAYQDFDFIDEGQTDRDRINWRISNVPDIKKSYADLQLKHVYGHGTLFTGSKLSRSYQGGESRTDAVVVSNPCISQEFALAIAGRIYVVEKFLSDYKKDVIDVVLPGLDFDDSNNANRAKPDPKYYEIKDVAFTPTHFAVLKEDSSVYLQSHSIFYQGFAYLTEIPKFRLDAFVKRKWCSKSSYQKTSNMLIPGFGRHGVIMFIQIFPTDLNPTIRLGERKNTCISKKEADISLDFEEVYKKYVNESCIHQKEAVVYSNEQGLSVVKDFSSCKIGKQEDLEDKDINDDADEKLKYVKNFGVKFAEFDSHFPREVVNPALYKINENKENYNLALIYKVDPGGVAGEKIALELKKNSLTIEGTTLKHGVAGLTLHALEFTAEDKRFLFAVQFSSEEVSWKDESAEAKNMKPISMVVAVLYTRDLAAKLYPTPYSVTDAPVLNTGIQFPGSFFVRSNHYVPKVIGNSSPYVSKLSTISTALPTYALDFGDVVVFSSLEGRYARPLSYFSRKDIHEQLKAAKHGSLRRYDPLLAFVLKSEKRKTIIKECGVPLNDFLMTEQGFVSVLRRRPEKHEELNSDSDTEVEPSCENAANASIQGQSILIGSIHTLDGLREVKPFTTEDNIFQMTTPDGEIVYGKFTSQNYYPVLKCHEQSVERFNKNRSAPSVNEKSCIIQDPSQDPFCVLDSHASDCVSWKDNNIESCNETIFVGCMYVGKNGRPLLKDYPSKEIGKASMLSVQFNSLLNGNLQMVTEEKLTEPPGADKIRNFHHIKATQADHICPYSDFRIEYVPFNFAEIGFSTRITAFVSYYGILLPADIDLLVEFDEEPGVRITTTSSVSQQKDEVTITKTIEVEFTLTDQALHRMKKEKLTRTDFREKINLDRELHSVFSITIRPSIVNTKCNKEDFYSTVQYNIGCYPFNKMRLLAEATPVIKKTVYRTKDERKNKNDWYREGDFLILPRAHVWHKQRKDFKCENEKNNNDTCKIQFAYLFGDQVYDVSWRDPFVPQFEQILSSRARKVEGNVVVYNMLNYKLKHNTTMLTARCYNNGSIVNDNDTRREPWYSRLQASVTVIGQQAHEREDIYQYYTDCFDASSERVTRDTPQELDKKDYSLVNLTNRNRIRFDLANSRLQIRTKNRNQIYIIRAAVVNTYFNRFTYCQLMDTFFLIRVVGIPTPRKALDYITYACLICVLLLFLFLMYLFFSYVYTWKLDVVTMLDAQDRLTRKDFENEYELNLEDFEEFLDSEEADNEEEAN